MIITRSPIRVSFVGGGSDFPKYFRENGGAVLSTTINKYVYVTCRHLPPYFDHKYRILWSFIENVKEIDEIQNHIVRECLKFMKCKDGLEIHYDGDVPARSGLGSSSSFTVGLLNALYKLNGIHKTKMQLAKDAIYVEQELVRDNCGCQDQIASAVGGFNKITFGNDIQVHSVSYPEELESWLMLIYTGQPRSSSEIAKTYQFNPTEMKEMCKMVDDGVKILGNKDIIGFGKLLDEAWRLKKTLSSLISSKRIDELYDDAKKNGAIGGKLCGSGSSGFLLLVADPEKQEKIKESLYPYLYVPIAFEDKGSEVIFDNGND